ncbi:hypothetical protein ACFWMJ_26760 [Streptomyces hawaiiensis]|uniref:hypothetical protein n=1 Tax=Streptomyces hawaiiensis TaxID=67305 RepID=UPI00364A0C0F
MTSRRTSSRPGARQQRQGEDRGGEQPGPRLGATRKDDRAWEFAFGLDCVLDGIGQRLGI